MPERCALRFACSGGGSAVRNIDSVKGGPQDPTGWLYVPIPVP
jgi:hypothetical protein